MSVSQHANIKKCAVRDTLNFDDFYSFYLHRAFITKIYSLHFLNPLKIKIKIIYFVDRLRVATTIFSIVIVIV